MEELVELPIPKLTDLDKLYLRVYLHTLSHPKAHEAVSPSISSGKVDNPYSRKEAIKYHIKKELQKKAESLSLDANKIIEMLYNEAMSFGAGTNQSARVNAITLLGKNLGMFKEKSDKDNIQINILNYSPDNKSIVEEIEKGSKEEKPLLDEVESIEGVEIIDFTSEKIEEAIDVD